MRKFTLELKAAKNIDHIKKCSKQKFFRIKFPTKKSTNVYLYHRQEWFEIL